MNEKEISTFTLKQIQVMQMRFTMICGLLPLLDNKPALRQAIKDTAKQYGCSVQTIKNYLAAYQASGCKEALAPLNRKGKEELTDFEKDIRWALNKYYYSTAKRTLKDAYTLMIKERYYRNGTLEDSYPSFWQFRYYYRNHNKPQNEIISRQGLSAYQRDYRPLLGEGVRDYCPAVGSFMLDSTISDIYLVDDTGKLLGRPILTAAADGYSGLLCGYSIGWEGGCYSLRNLMQNIITDKVKYCRSFGIEIDESQWPCNKLGGKMITDRGKEYASENFAQLTELGITIENLPPFRPDLKGVIEQFFNLVQEQYKPYLKGKGIIEPDFMQRGGTDYRKLACLTLRQFETIIIHCIIFYNSRRIIENFPYTAEMLEAKVKPYSVDIWNWSIKNDNAVNLLSVDADVVRLTLLPRTTARFTRRGLMMKGLRYKADGFQNEYLEGRTVTVAYDPDNVSRIHLLEDGVYTAFYLIDSRFAGASFEATEEIKEQQKMITASEKEDALLAKVRLAEHIEAIVGDIYG